ncbi:MAG TPA: biotin/lipoate A/B protein ligase family protein [Candidatus Nanoarchaeia archaeon]|nr:biotin/lipoate A/B protein ligase family protein [Candidatus Nanoarchaeia archaeon]
MNWRLIEQQAYNAAMNMAIDEDVYESVASGKQLPTIRFYKWKNNSVSLGTFQNQSEINLEKCKKNNVDVVRRITGGRAVYHDKMDFTYSVVAPIKIFDSSISNAYKEICSWIIGSLNDLGIKSKLENKNDIMVNNKKISGNAAKLMEKGIYLQHGTLVYDIDFELMPKVLNITKELAKEKITSVSEFKKIDNNKVYETLKNNFSKNKEIKIETLSKEELKRAKELATTKYNSTEADKDILLRNKGACYVLSGN